MIARLDFMTCPFAGSRLRPTPHTPYLIANSAVATPRAARKEIAIHVPPPLGYRPKNHRRSTPPCTAPPPPHAHLANRGYAPDRCETMPQREGRWKTPLPFRSRPWLLACRR